MGKYGTPFTESEALLAVTAEDAAEAQRIINEMLPNERRALMRACDMLSSMCWTSLRKDD